MYLQNVDFPLLSPPQITIDGATPGHSKLHRQR